MSLLLDTHVLLWWLEGDARLGAATTELIAEPHREVMVSAASVWEIAIKQSIGKLELSIDVVEQLRDQSFGELPVRVVHAVEAGSLPSHHRDPFDRMLVAQARLEDLTIVTADPAIGAYDVARHDART